MKEINQIREILRDFEADLLTGTSDDLTFLMKKNTCVKKIMDILETTESIEQDRISTIIVSYVKRENELSSADIESLIDLILRSDH